MRRISEQTLRTAAERLVARGNANAVILYGSRARGDAVETSDWDVCLVGHPPRGMAHAPWNDARVEPVWMAPGEFANGVHAGSLAEAIAREGKVLAGDGAVMKDAETLPFRIEDARQAVDRAAERIENAVRAAEAWEHAQAAFRKERASAEMSIEAIGASEALARALRMLTGARHSGTHDIAKNARRVQAQARNEDAPLPRKLIESIAKDIAQMNGNAKALRAAEYGRSGETHAQATQRLAHTLDVDRQLRQGLSGHGRWAGLAEHRRAADLAALVEEDTAQHAQEHARTTLVKSAGVGDEALNAAIDRWLNTFQATLFAHGEKEHGDRPGR